MMRNRIIVAVAAMLPMMAAQAHQGWSSYDTAQILTVRAPLKLLNWGQPHGSAKVRWKRADWDVVLAPVSRMKARGLTQDMIDDGQMVTLIGYPRSGGVKEMRVERVIIGEKIVELR